MAEIAIAGAIAVVKQAVVILANLAAQEGSRLFNLKQDMEWIETEMGYIQASLEDADANDEQHGSRVEATLLNNIRILAYDVEDAVETYFPQIASYERTGCLGCLKSVTCSLCRGYVYRNFVTEIEAIRRRINDIPRVKQTYEMKKSRGSSGGDIWARRRDFLHHVEPKIVGFDEYVKTLVARILERDLQHPVISIVGLPGLGKTTLAKKVYNSVEHRFECKAKVAVSQRPDVKQLLQEVAEQVGLEKEMREKNVEANLRAYLEDKRYVIFFDDIWDTQSWLDLKIVIPNNCKTGSTIILTSRNREVGLMAGESSLFEFQPLKPDDSWDLFSEVVMGPLGITNDTSNYQELEPVGRKIVERCGGLPLAIVVVAGLLLVREKTGDEWKGVLQSMGQDDDMCSKIMALSYKDLPIELKPCFLYFGLFPEDYEISTFELINLWVAERFVQSKGERAPEDVGHDYLNHLIARNLIQVVRRNFNGRIRSCRIHDVLHSLCIRVAKEINFFNTHGDVSTNNPTGRVRRVTTHRSDSANYISLNHQTPKLRAFLCFKGYLRRKTVKHFLQEDKFLRVLRVECYYFSRSILNEVGNLRHLNYLELGSLVYSLIELPYTISNLESLQTLDLRRCSCVRLPSVIWNMKQLRHILLPPYCEAPKLCGVNLDRWLHPITEICLPNLQTLHGLPGHLFEADWLHKLTSLRKLGINGPTDRIIEVLSDVTPVSQKLENLWLRYLLNYSNTLNLSRYKNLRNLRLNKWINKLPQHDKLPPNLTKLTLDRTRLQENPMETLEKLPKLKILKLLPHSYMGRKMVCSGEPPANFPQLEVLVIDGTPHLEELIIEEGVMPRLKYFTTSRTNLITRIPDRIRNIMTIS